MVLRPLGLGAPLRWLTLGLRDLARAPAVGLFYGACFWLMAAVLGWVFRTQPEYTMSLASGCLLLGPFLALGLYDASRRHEAGQAAHLGQSLVCWRSHMGRWACWCWC